MTDTRKKNTFGSQLLLQEDALSDSQYRDYRRKLEQALTFAERREKVVYWLCTTSFVVSLTLMFVGGSKILGDFDPWSKSANFWSVAAGVVYILATSIFFLSLASFFSRFQPGSKDARDRLRDATLLDLQRQVHELRQQIALATPPGASQLDHPRSEDPPVS